MANYDVIIIGSGLAGLTAGLFSARHGLATLVMESNIPGGHLIGIEKIEDFPGFPDGNPRLRSLPEPATPSFRLRRRVSARRSHAPRSPRKYLVGRLLTKSNIAPRP
jgi:flavin-dependent dehydrogenase